jgi:hypothetical protein
MRLAAMLMESKVDAAPNVAELFARLREGREDGDGHA